jgi:hypothetical protein
MIEDQNIQPLPPESVEVSQPAVVPKGEIKFATMEGLKYQPPAKLQVAVKVINYFCAGLVTMVGATDLFSGRQAKIICFILGALVLLCGAVEKATGVKPTETKP